MAHSPDLAPLEDGVNSNFKQNIAARKATTIAGLKKIIHEEWAKFDVGRCRQILSSWSSRVDLMVQNKGFQMEHLLK